MNNKQDVLISKSFDFALRILNLQKYLIKEHKEFVISHQIIKSGTSIGVNIREAKGAISRVDFSAKISIAYKESLETQYWLELLYRGEYIREKLFKSLFVDCEELSKILYVSLKTSRP